MARVGCLLLLLCFLLTASTGRQLQQNLAGASQGCTDVAPPGDKTCAQLKDSGDCNTSVTSSRNYCAATCSRCTPSATSEATAASPAIPPQPEPSSSTVAASPGAVPAPASEQESTTAAAAAQAPSSEPTATAAATQSNAAAPSAETSATSAASSGNSSSAAPAAGSGEVFKGDGTAFSEKVDNTGKGFACSFRYLNDWASVHFAAVNLPQWDNGNSCGRCATVRCVDSRCKTQDVDVTVMIVDQCPECKHGDLDFSIPVYREITGMWPHRLQVQWQWADCSPFINGTIHSAPKDGGNPFWQAFYFSNTKYPLSKVVLNGMELKRNQFGFYEHGAPLGNGPHKFEFSAANGAVVTATTDDPLKVQDLNVQFPEVK